MFVALAVGCTIERIDEGGSQADAPTDRAAILAVQDSLIAAENRGDLGAVVGLFTEDAILMPPRGVRTIVGRDSVRAHFQRRFEEGRWIRAAEPGEPEVGETLAHLVGREGGVYITRAYDTIPTFDRYIMVLRRDEQGRWRIARLAWQAVDPA